MNIIIWLMIGWTASVVTRTEGRKGILLSMVSELSARRSADGR
jgi:uncharacterized membrane protein YeaQ/YmgE (transglycosylase-associated protein family)